MLLYTTLTFVKKYTVIIIGNIFILVYGFIQPYIFLNNFFRVDT